MQIDTHSKTSMEQSLCRFLNINQDNYDLLYREIYTSAKEPWKYISDFVDDHWNGIAFDKVQFYHLTRRLNGTDIKECFNLKTLLTTPKSIF